MSTATATETTISNTTEHELLASLEVDFEDFRSRIARLSATTSGVLTGMFSPLAPIALLDSALLDVIDIVAIEQVEVSRVEAAIEPLASNPLALGTPTLELLPA